MKNYYYILGVESSASSKGIKRAFQAKAKEWHPDKHTLDGKLAEATEKFKVICYH